MHTFDHACAARHIFDQSQYFHPRFRRNALHTRQEFLHILADFGASQVLVEGKGRHDPAGDIMGQPRDLIDVPGNVVLGAIGQERIGIESAAFCFRSHGGAGHRAGIDRFGQVHHLDELVLDVGGIRRSLILGGQGRGADDDIGHAALASSVILPVQCGKPLDEHAAEFDLAAHEDPLPRDENIFEDNEGFAAHNSEFLVSGINAVFELSFFIGLAPENEGDPFGRQGNRRRDGIGLIAFGHILGGHDENLMAVDGAGHVDFGPADDDTVFPLFDNMGEQIGIGLFTGALGPVALGVRHAADDHEIFRLDHLEKLDKTWEILRSVGFIDFIGGHVQGIHGIKSDTTLITAPRFMGDEAEHLDLFNQVIHGLVDMSETVDLLSRQMARRRHQVFIFRHGGPVRKFLPPR